MKPTLPPFLERVRDLTAATLEDQAEEIFDIETVRGLVIAAAGEGFRQTVIRPPRPVDLRPTAAAKAAVKHLEDSGFKVFWESFTLDGSGQRMTGYEMHIEWS